jgi:hypothetical protein
MSASVVFGRLFDFAQHWAIVDTFMLFQTSNNMHSTSKGWVCFPSLRPAVLANILSDSHRSSSWCSMFLTSLPSNWYQYPFLKAWMIHWSIGWWTAVQLGDRGTVITWPLGSETLEPCGPQLSKIISTVSSTGGLRLLAWWQKSSLILLRRFKLSLWFSASISSSSFATLFTHPHTVDSFRPLLLAPEVLFEPGSKALLAMESFLSFSCCFLFPMVDRVVGHPHAPPPGTTFVGYVEIRTWRPLS